MAIKRPSFQFYPSDWLRDIALRCVSLEARGMWIDMLCYMHDGTPYGYLKVNNKVILPVNLAHILSINLDVVQRLLQELLEAGVCSQDGAGCIYSRRMVKDEEIRLKRAAGGFLGGNPTLKKVNHKVRNKVNLTPNLTPEEEEEEEKEEVIASKKEKKELEFKNDPEKFTMIWDGWIKYKKAQHGQKYKTIQSEQIALNNLYTIAGDNPDTALEIVNNSIANLYQGLIKPKNNGNNQQHKPNPLASFNRFAKAAIEANRIVSEGRGDEGDLFTEIYGQAPR